MAFWRQQSTTTSFSLHVLLLSACMYIQVWRTTRTDQPESRCTHLQVCRTAIADQLVSCLTAPINQLSSLFAKLNLLKLDGLQSCTDQLKRSCHDWRNKSTYQLLSFFPPPPDYVQVWSTTTTNQIVNLLAEPIQVQTGLQKSNQLLISSLNLFKIKGIQPQIRLHVYAFDRIYLTSKDYNHQWTYKFLDQTR